MPLDRNAVSKAAEDLRRIQSLRRRLPPTEGDLEGLPQAPAGHCCKELRSRLAKLSRWYVQEEADRH